MGVVRLTGNTAQTPEFVDFVFRGANLVPQSHFPDEVGQSDKRMSLDPNWLADSSGSPPGLWKEDSSTLGHMWPPVHGAVKDTFVH